MRRWLKAIPGAARVHWIVSSAATSAWTCDRAQLRGLRALANRLFRVVIAVVRGVVVHRLALLAAALTFFAVFSIVPMLVVVLWGLKAVGRLPAVSAQLPRSPGFLSGNQVIYEALRHLLDTVHHASQVPGLVGLLALLYVAGKMFAVSEKALHTIAGAGRQRPRFARAVGYLALLLMPPAVLAVSGVLLGAFREPVGAKLQRALDLIPGLDLTVGMVLGIAVLWLEATVFYWSAVRARIPFRSAAVGGLASAVALPVVLWAYANLQIGVSQTSALGSEFLAFPVFLLWMFSSWYVLLIGAEIAVAIHVDGVLAHGARAFHLDLDGERQASAAIVLRTARAARSNGGGARGAVSIDQLARELRLPPRLVRHLCVRLVERGLLIEGAAGFSLRPDPDRTAFAAVIDAVERDPRLDQGRSEAASGFPPRARAALAARRPAVQGGVTLGQLADEAPDGERRA
jgi:membrane protein